MSDLNDRLFSSIWNKNASETERLLQDGADINSYMSDTGWTPLILAIKNNDPQMVRKILSYPNLQINHIDKEGLTAYKHAILKEKRISNNPNMNLGNIEDTRQIINMLENNPRLIRNLGDSIDKHSRNILGGRKSIKIKKNTSRKYKKQRKAKRQTKKQTKRR